MDTFRSPTGRSFVRRVVVATMGDRAGEGLARSHSRRTDGTRDEGGAVMILALVFLIVVGGIVSVLASSVSSHLKDSGEFATTRSLQYAATSAIDLAIDNIRYTPFLGAGETLNASPPSQCWNPTPGSPFNPNGAASQWAGVDNAPAIAVWCSTEWQPSSAQTRIVTISACLYSAGAAAFCAANPMLEVQVAFDDYPTGVSAATPGVCSVYCGSGMNVLSWLWSPTVPIVTDLRTADGTSGGPIVGGTAVELTGTGFVPGSTYVNFIQESNGTPVSVGSLAPVTPTSDANGIIYVPSPPVTKGTTYFVTVTTPTGTSAYTNSTLHKTFVFTYNVAAASETPTVTSMSVSHVTPAAGTNNGGDFIMITGTNFYTGAGVNFIEQSGGSLVLAATDVTVVDSTHITAITPGTISGTLTSNCASQQVCQTNYAVKVTTPAGSSPAVSADLYQYNLPSPIVIGIGPNATTQSTSYSGARGTAIVVTGRSFWGSGTSVIFAPYSNSSCSGFGGTTVSSVTVSSPFALSVIPPASLQHNGSYCVEVDTTSDTSANIIVFTASS